MIHIHLNTIISFFLIFLAGIVIPAHLKFKTLTREKFSGNYMVFHEASRNRKNLIMAFLLSGSVLLYKYPLDIPSEYLENGFGDYINIGIHVSVCFLIMLVGGKIGNFLLKYFEDKK